MSKISLGEIVSDYIDEMKKIAPSYGTKSFSDQSNISRTYIWTILKRNDMHNFSNNIIVGVAKTIKIKEEDLKFILSSDDGKEIYFKRKELLKKANDILQKSSNDELEVYLSLFEKISTL